MALKSTWQKVDELEADKQDNLVSGTNIKTINGSSILGSGNLVVSGGGGISDGDKGDITVSGSGSVWTIDNGAVTNAKINDVAATKVTEDATHRFVTDTEKTTWNGKQDALVSGTNIKTINSTSLLGSGNVSVQETLVSGTNIKTINSTSLLGSGDITIGSSIAIGTTPITGGTIGRILFENGGNVVGQDSELFWDNTNKRLGVGATPSTSVRLDVKAQGALSTDVVFRLRNSANTANHFIVNGDNTFILGRGSLDKAFQYLSDGRLFMAESGSNFIELNPSATNNRIYGGGQGWEISTTSNTKVMEMRTPSTALMVYGGTMQLSTALNASDGTNVFSVRSGTAPTGNYTDSFKMYSADIVAGNAAPHFRTENGNIIKIYQETTGVTEATRAGSGGTNLTSNTTFDGYTLAKVVKALRNLGILA